MSSGFLAVLSQSDLNREKFESAFVAHTLWARDGGARELEACGPNWRVTCLRDDSAGTSAVWKATEAHGPELQGCFVYCLGWCYRVSSVSECLRDDEFTEMVERFRADVAPLSDDFGGQFVVVVYDAKRHRLAVQPDRLAIGAAFLAGQNGEFAASNRALRVAQYFGCALDGHSVTSQMRGTHLPFGRTLFAGVRRMMGSTYLEFDFDRGVAQIKKPNSLYVPARKISYGDSVDLVRDTVERTVRRLLAASPVRFDLTGGNDTRVVASAVECITRNNGHAAFAFRVADPEGSPDVRIASRVAGSCGWPLVRLDRGASVQPSLDELQVAATTSDGSFPAQSVWERVLAERGYANQFHAKTHVGAPAGEIFRGYFYAQEMLALGRTSKVNYDALLAYRTYASRQVDLKLFGAAAPSFEEHDEILLAPYRAIGDEGGSLPNTNNLDLMYLQRHCYRSGNTLSWLLGFLNVRLPFLSWELAGLALSLPWKYRANRGLMQRVIGKLSPKLASIPNEDGEPMKPLSVTTFPWYVAAEIPIGVDRAGRVVRRLLGRSGGTKTVKLPAPPPAYIEVVENARSLPSICDMNLVRHVSAVAQSGGSRDASTTLYVLCTLESLLQAIPALQPRIEFA